MRRATTSRTEWHKLTTHGTCEVLFLLDALMLTQLMGVAFAGGTLLGTLVSVATLDLAFAWQSTLDIGPAGLHVLVSAIALPWAWLPDTWNLIPSMEQIEGSRIILKDGIGHLHSTHLIAWWKFLAMGVLVYALLPRMAMLSWTYVLLRREEKAFAHPLHEHIVLRMRSPLIDLPRTEESPSQPFDVPPAPTHDATVTAPPTAPCLVLVPEELLPRLDTHATARLGRELGCAHIETHPLPDDANALRSVFAACPEAPRRVVLLIEAWQPPIQENRRALAELLRPDITPHTVAVLTGRPHTNTWLTPPTRSDFEVWRTALAAIAPIAVRAVGQDQ